MGKQEFSLSPSPTFLPTFNIGEKVYARNYGQGEKWLPAKISKKQKKTKKNLVPNSSLWNYCKVRWYGLCHLNQSQRYEEDSDLIGTKNTTSGQVPREPIEYPSSSDEESRVQSPVDIAVDVAPESAVEQPILPLATPTQVRHPPDRYSLRIITFKGRGTELSCLLLLLW